jgi:hypothetical protein
MSPIGSGGQVRRGILGSPAFVVASVLLVTAACGSGLESPNLKPAESAVLSSSSKLGDAGPQYSYEIFDVPGATKTWVANINDEGVAVGTYIDGDGGYHGFIRKLSGAISTVDVDGAVGTLAWGINDLGAVVGYFNTLDDQHGFLRKPDGTIQTIDFEPFQGFDGTATTGINNRGEIVGGYGPTYNIGFILRDGRFFPSPEPPGVSNPPWIFPNGINDLGVTSGFFQDPAGVDHGYVLRGTRYTIVDFPGSANTGLWSVNDLGQVAADSDSGCGYIFDLTKETFEPLPCVGDVSVVYALNNRGQFVGASFENEAPDVSHGFIATPVRHGE